MIIDIQCWAHEKFGGSPIDGVDISRGAIGLKSGASCIYYYAGSEEGIIDFKNKVLWAYEEYLRNKRSSG
uniref:Uncharacterized protein n=1 Tax=viral metagenome TaxID=1070528 RepID=A0A6M3XUP2_9ZZZZ